MKKNIKLSSKKPTEKAPKPKKETRFFFIKDQGEGAVRVVIIVFKLLELFLTTVFAVCIGIIAPVILMTGEGENEISYAAAAIPWITASVLYIAGLFLMIFNRSKTGAAVHIIAAVCTLVTYGSFLGLFKDFPDFRAPAHLFMPCLLVTALSVSIMLMINIPIWWKRYLEKQNEKAPSILGDDDK